MIKIPQKDYRRLVGKIASSLGFELWGISPPFIQAEYKKQIDDWYQKAWWGDMTWLKDHQPFKNDPQGQNQKAQHAQAKHPDVFFNK